MKLNCTEDKLDRCKHLKPLTKLLTNIGDESFVMTVSSAYGSGKTFFINEWQKYLNEGGCKTLYYNAWENDTADNPLMSFIANFQELKIPLKVWKEVLVAAGKVCVAEALSNIETIGRFITPFNSILGGAVVAGGKAAQKAKKATDNFIDKVKCESIFLKQIEAENDRKKQIDELKKVLQKLMPSKSQEKTDYPIGKLIIFIDDLDRCSPAYAIKFLEYIKHVFNAENCIFVLAVDEEQLKSSVEVVYGNKNGEDFLAKIVDFRFKLPTPNISSFINYFINELNWEPYFMVGQNWAVTPQDKKQNFINIFNALSKYFQLSARDILHICCDLDMVFKSHEPEYVSPVYILLVYVLENYKYKIWQDLKPLINQYGGDKFKAFKHFFGLTEYYIIDSNNVKRLNGYSNSVVTVKFEAFISLLNLDVNVKSMQIHNEAFYALSLWDFSKRRYFDVYSRTKAIIADVLEINEQRISEFKQNENAIFNLRNGFIPL